jgi:hypothetical protein
MSSATATPSRAERPNFPPDYGIHPATSGMLPWKFVQERMARARNYWIATSRPNGRPHAMPVWGVWVDEMLCFGTDRDSRKARNLAANAAVVAHLESGKEVVIIEGVAVEVTDRERLSRIDEEYFAKYKMRLLGFSAGAIIYSVQPRVAFAWRERNFPRSATCWRLVGNEG